MASKSWARGFGFRPIAFLFLGVLVFALFALVWMDLILVDPYALILVFSIVALFRIRPISLHRAASCPGLARAPPLPLSI